MRSLSEFGVVVPVCQHCTEKKKKKRIGCIYDLIGTVLLALLNSQHIRKARDVRRDDGIHSSFGCRTACSSPVKKIIIIGMRSS